MTSQQRAVLNAARNEFDAAEEAIEPEQAKMAAAESVLEAAYRNVTIDAPAAAAKLIQDAKDNLAKAQASRDAQFAETSAAYVRLQNADQDLRNAQRDSLITNAVEKV